MQFVEENGHLKLTFDENGHWVTIETSATAPLSFDAVEGREIAFKMAKMHKEFSKGCSLAAGKCPVMDGM